ncbi:hypothetical protein [Tuwongella immobilis]|uniref:YD repeat protein n=1 Tax=Tuwongella immobilis TaxID=692036 RepID=A0A6C2YHC6_9BACT|nr:YD repeat protein OS=Isosphaera pallida (strain ATCC 43644 / DSM 9630 / IS1B) GN=Isop_2419 PE=4 SV=1 [Tuwongella immobilis]VTR97274.1 YD repeat protein OS=Isosphaera pallida (strain ATCC 43644 / DSM 9630 / IS1B) GN=Isop_2419 PE=4 SV=1 [Tuwongella immobilis]
MKDSLGVTITEYQYDGLNRRVIEESGSGVNHLLVSQGWQVLEERADSSSTPHTQYVYSPVYIDAIITITRDSDANGSLDQRLWVVQDSNWNVTALLNDSGIVVEHTWINDVELQGYASAPA